MKYIHESVHNLFEHYIHGSDNNIGFTEYAHATHPYEFTWEDQTRE